MSDDKGIGSKCIKGSKILGIRPNEMEEIDKDYIKSTRLKCLDLKIDDIKTKNKVTRDIFDM
jgi:hypothetical protein